MTNIGKGMEVGLRELWKHEQYVFSNWLAMFRRYICKIWTMSLVVLIFGCLVSGCGQTPQGSELQPSLSISPESSSVSANQSDGTASEKPYYLENLIDSFGWCGMPADNLGIHHSYIGDYGIEIEGNLFGGYACGTAGFAIPGTEEKIINDIYLYVQNSDLPAEDCLTRIQDLYGLPVDQGEEPYAAANGGTVTWNEFKTGNGKLKFSIGSENDWYQLEFTWNPEAAPKYEYATGDFDVSNPKWNQIRWDADGDGVEEELLFEYQDNGDEAPSVIEITLYTDDGEYNAVIDRAYGLTRILEKEDAEGPYLEINYTMGDYYAHNSEGRCILRFRNGALSLYGEEEPLNVTSGT